MLISTMIHWHHDNGIRACRIGLVNLNRWIIVPIAAVFCFGIGYGITALVGLLWHGMPDIVRWGAPGLLVGWYLYDAMKREQPQK
jgi:hypothetical protein